MTPHSFGLRCSLRLSQVLALGTCARGAIGEVSRRKYLGRDAAKDADEGGMGSSLLRFNGLNPFVEKRSGIRRIGDIVRIVTGCLLILHADSPVAPNGKIRPSVNTGIAVKPDYRLPQDIKGFDQEERLGSNIVYPSLTEGSFHNVVIYIQRSALFH